jgi:glycosyltransferase involved in cell wall biosynthesis
MSKPRAVLLMARELGIGGTERQLALTAMALDRTRFEPHVACFHDDGFRARELRNAGVPIVRLPVRSFLSPSAVEGAWLMGRYLRAHDIRLVHTFDVPMDLFGAPVARFFRTPVVISSQRAHRSLTPGVRTHLLRLTDRLVDGIVVNSLAVEQELIESHGAPRSLVHLWRNALDCSRFCPRPAVRQPQLEGASVVIGTICALRPEKGLDTLLDAFALIRDVRPGLKLAIIGSGPSSADLEARSQRLGLAGSCRFIPAASDVPEWLRSIDVFVLPSRSESLSNSLMEAMACGCCVVASSAGGNPELVTDGVTGLLFPAGDAFALAERLRRLIAADPQLRLSLSAAAAAHAHGSFSTGASIARISEIYTKLLDACDGRPRA